MCRAEPVTPRDTPRHPGQGPRACGPCQTRPAAHRSHEAVFCSHSSSPHMAANPEYQACSGARDGSICRSQREKPGDRQPSSEKARGVAGRAAFPFRVHPPPAQMAPASLFFHRLQIKCNALWDLTKFHPLTDSLFTQVLLKSQNLTPTQPDISHWEGEARSGCSAFH